MQAPESNVHSNIWTLEHAVLAQLPLVLDRIKADHPSVLQGLLLCEFAARKGFVGPSELHVGEDLVAILPVCCKADAHHFSMREVSRVVHVPPNVVPWMGVYIDQDAVVASTLVDGAPLPKRLWKGVDGVCNFCAPIVLLSKNCDLSIGSRLSSKEGVPRFSQEEIDKVLFQFGVVRADGRLGSDLARSRSRALCWRLLRRELLRRLAWEQFKIRIDFVCHCCMLIDAVWGTTAWSRQPWRRALPGAFVGRARVRRAEINCI